MMCCVRKSGSYTNDRKKTDSSPTPSKTLQHQNIFKIVANTIKRIVLTGGPCAGKTTALVKVTDYFTNLGYKVFTVPEVPTMVTQAGWNYMTDNKAFYYEGELIILELQLKLEDAIMRMANTLLDEQPCLIICDRGTMDISAYISPEMWQELADRAGYTIAQLRERYDAVLHLVTAADGAEEYYTTANNAQRYEQANEEGLRLARMLDKKVLTAWSMHPHLRIVDNGSDFETKLNRVLQEISEVLELPLPIKEERKYIVEVIGALPDGINTKITQTYLTAEPNSEIRLRRSVHDGHTQNIHTIKRRISQTENVITERHVNNNLYESLMKQADPYRCTINKQRKSFIWQGQHFELDTYLAPLDGLVILETKGKKSHDDVNFPPFLRVVKDITGMKDYYNYNLALK